MHFTSRFYHGIILFFIFSFLLFPAVSAEAGDFSTGPETEISEKVNDEAIEKLREMTPEEIDALDKKLAEALILYYDRKFGQALPIFREVAGQAETMDIMWWLGTSAMKVGETRLAIEKFKKMLEINPDLHRVRLELATAYFKLQRYDEARQELETVQAAKPPEAVRKNIEKLLAAIDESTRKVVWHVRFSQGLQFDDNASSGPDQRELAVTGGTLTLGNESVKLRDEALITNLMGNVVYDFGERQGLMWNTTGAFYNSAYQSYSKFNFMMVDFTTGPWWVGRRDIVKCPVGYKEQYYGSERLSHVFHINPSYEHYFSPYFSLAGSYSFNKEFYYNTTNASLDNSQYRYEINPSIYLADRRHIISAALGFEDRNAEARRYCYDAWYYSLSYLTRLSAKTELFVRYKWTERDYKEKPLLYSQDRKDKQHNIMAVLSQEFLEYFFATVTFNYTDNDSNASLYEFDKTTYTFDVGFKF
ncbi:MAG: DUF560 domain-containing protein [Deltaproteobacteria bacterium]|nr:DUF560 domain-containing protein [Deltaproteobacteria bacterium]MBW2595389.1 DUF560 domain-containing protein [Deltaproteobacteria bacterium]